MKGVLDAIDAEAEEKAKAVIREAEEFSVAKKEQMRKQAERDNDELFAIEEKSIVRFMRKREEKVRERNLLEMMRLRDRIINEVWEEAAERFLTMPKRKDEYRKFLDNVFSMAGERGYVVYLRAEDLPYRKGAKPADISGGAVFRTTDGKIEVDYSLDGILARSEEAAKAVIAEVLFG